MSKRSSGAKDFAPYPYPPIGSAEILAASGEPSEFDWPEPPEYAAKTPPMNPTVAVSADHRY